MGLMGGIELEDLNGLTLAIQPGNLQRLYKMQLSPEERDKRRAELLREKLAGITAK
jgi:protein arginine kinase